MDEGVQLSHRSTRFLLHTSLSPDQPGSLPSSSPAHQPGSERQLGSSLRHHPAGRASGQHVFSSPDCKPSTDVSPGTDGESPSWAMAQVSQEDRGREVGSWAIKEGWQLEKGGEEAPGGQLVPRAPRVTQFLTWYDCVPPPLVLGKSFPPFILSSSIYF